MKSLASVALAAALIGTSCAGPTSPSPAPTSATFAGVWRGTITLTPAGSAPQTFQTEWTLAETPQTSGLGYTASLRSSSAWFPASSTGTVTVVPPGALPSDLRTVGFYASPRGCSGSSFYSQASATPSDISGSFYGVDCLVAFDGTVHLSR